MKILRWMLVIVLALVALPAIAVTIRSDPTPGATHCGLYKNGTYDADYPVADVGGGLGCLFVIDIQAPGTTIVYAATAVVVDARWGRTESPRSLPLSVARPAAPTTPNWAANAVRAGVSGMPGAVATLR
jgi:hypothetical protein